MKRWIACIVALIATLAAAPIAFAETAVTTIEHGESVASDSMVPPQDSAPWRAVNLPDAWNLSRPGFNGQIWYRFAFTTLAAKQSHALYVPRNSATDIEFFINGEPLSLGVPYGDPRITELQRPLIFLVPAIMLRARDNVLQVRVVGSAEHGHGLSRLIIGNGRVVRLQYYETRYNLQVQSIAMFGAVLLVAGLLALSLLWTRRGEPVLLWFAVTSIAWAVSAYLLVRPPNVENPQARQLMFVAMQHLYVIPLAVLCLRISGARLPRLETALWFAFAAACGAAALLDFARFPAFAEAVSAAKFFLTVGALGYLVRVGIREHRWPLYSMGLALVMVIVVYACDWARWMGYADFDNLLLVPFAMPFLILALGAAGLERHLTMTRALERAKRELEQRVAEKVREAELAYRQMQQVRHQQAVLRERQHIMADMHDGLGSGLIGLLS